MGTLSLTKEAKTCNGKKDNLFNKRFQENWAAVCRRMKFRTLPNTIHRNNGLNYQSNWIKDLNIRPETMNLLEENIGRIDFYINHSNNFYDPLHKVLE